MITIQYWKINSSLVGKNTKFEVFPRFFWFLYLSISNVFDNLKCLCTHEFTDATKIVYFNVVLIISYMYNSDVKDRILWISSSASYTAYIDYMDLNISNVRERPLN